jgi:hypothetical protein
MALKGLLNNLNADGALKCLMAAPHETVRVVPTFVHFVGLVKYYNTTQEQLSYINLLTNIIPFYVKYGLASKGEFVIILQRIRGMLTDSRDKENEKDTHNLSQETYLGECFEGRKNVRVSA